MRREKRLRLLIFDPFNEKNMLFFFLFKMILFQFMQVKRKSFPQIKIFFFHLFYSAPDSLLLIINISFSLLFAQTFAEWKGALK